MKWNATRNQSLAPASTGEKVIRGTSRTNAGVTYEESWDNTRSITEGLLRSTWVYRAVDAIASNAARIPIILREDNPLDGLPVNDTDLYRLLNSAPNQGEDSVAFRYRLSAQLLLSDRGAFIEVSKTKGGEVLALTLLPPDAVTPIPDQKKFISGYKLSLNVKGQNGRTETIEKMYKPDQIIWVRKPHPFHAYGAITPLAAAGVAIESDWFAKMYNRNFLLNDGRPGGLVVVKGDMTEDDKDELRAKFGGSISRAGRISVIASEAGADFVDTAVTPREAAYIEARKINKDEILMAFGVPESVLANASGRTFDNAEMERHVFWMETMIPHLDLITRPLDALDPNPDTFVSYNLDNVDVLQRMEMKRREFLLRESDVGATSWNEYREATGRAAVPGELNDMLWISKSKNPVVTTEGMTAEDAGLVSDDTNPVGRPASDAVVEEPEEEPNEREDDRETPMDGTAKGVDSEDGSTLNVKSEVVGSVWNEVGISLLNGLLERASRVVAEKAAGHKFRKAFFAEDPDVEELVAAVVDESVWNKQTFEDFSGLARGITGEGTKGIEVGDTVRHIPISAHISNAVAEALEGELLVAKPDMKGLPDRLATKIVELENSPALRESVSSFVEFYS